MNILQFINSKDVREHLKAINYQFDSLEAAWLIYQSDNATITEKHNAWRELIETMPDCEIVERFNTKAQPSLHEYLKKYIDTETSLINDFFVPAKDWIYTLEWKENDEWFNLDKYFKTFDSTQTTFLEESKEWRQACIYRIKKQKAESTQHITVTFNQDNQPCKYDIEGYSSNIFDILYDVFEGLWFAFPTPFVPGDIVCQYNEHDNETFGFCRGAFVLKGITDDTAHERIKKTGDTSDMNAWGFFQYDDGMVYSEVMFNYMNLEYYRGSLTGKKRILKALGNFIKGKIDVGLLCNAYHYIICDTNAEAALPGGITDEGLKLVGIKD